MPKTLLRCVLFWKTALASLLDSYIDSTGLCVCKNTRAKRHRVFRGKAGWGKSRLQVGFLVSSCISLSMTGVIAECKMHFIIRMTGVLVRLRYFIWQALWRSRLYFRREAGSVTAGEIRHWANYNPTKKQQTETHGYLDKCLLRGRSLNETVNDQLKNICQIEHSRHRSASNFMVNLISGLLPIPTKKTITKHSACGSGCYLITSNSGWRQAINLSAAGW